MKSVWLVPSDVPDLLQAMSFAFLAAVIFLPSEHCANKKQAQLWIFSKIGKRNSHVYTSGLDCLNFSPMFKY